MLSAWSENIQNKVGNHDDKKEEVKASQTTIDTRLLGCSELQILGNSRTGYSQIR